MPICWNTIPKFKTCSRNLRYRKPCPTTQQWTKGRIQPADERIPSEDQEDVKISFWEVFDEFVKECGNQNNWTESTYEKFAAVKNHLKGVQGRFDLWIFQWVRTERIYQFPAWQKDMRNSTIGKTNGIPQMVPAMELQERLSPEYSIRYVQTEIENHPQESNLPDMGRTWTDLKTIRYPKTNSIWNVSDVFLFCCFTSLRYSDVRNLKRSDVKSDHIEVTTVKTADSLSIELNKYSKAILEKYKDIHFENHMALPVISNQKMNDYLKELGELAEINEPIRETYYKGNERIDEVTPKYALLSTHAGRRTFICNAGSGIPGTGCNEMDRAQWL